MDIRMPRGTGNYYTNEAIEELGPHIVGMFLSGNFSLSYYSEVVRFTKILDLIAHRGEPLSIALTCFIRPDKKNIKHGIGFPQNIEEMNDDAFGCLVHILKMYGGRIKNKIFTQYLKDNESILLVKMKNGSCNAEWILNNGIKFGLKSEQKFNNKSEQKELKRKSEVKLIANQNNIKQLVHLTNIKNLKSIIKRGLLPLSELEDMDLIRKKEVTPSDEYRLDNRTNTISLSINNANSSMFYTKIMNSTESYAMLLVKPSVLWQLECAFCYTNAASNDIRFKDADVLKKPEMLKKLLKINNEQAEVLCFEKIDVDAIEHIFIPGEIDNYDCFEDTSIDIDVTYGFSRKRIPYIDYELINYKDYYI